MNNDLMFSSKNAQWETPAGLFNDVNWLYRFNVDCAANARNTKCCHFYDDFLNAELRPGTRGWLNPPYGRGIGDFVEHAWNQTRKPRVIIVLLLPSRTDTTWWQQFCEPSHYKNIPGRVTFEINGKPVTDKHGRPMPAPFPNSLVTMISGRYF